MGGSVDPYEQYAEVYSISDLHLSVGDRRDRDSVAGLARAIDALTACAKKAGAAALVVNGDTVDFLDIPPQTYFDPFAAPDKLQAVFDANEPFWTALRNFAAVGNVVLTLGNHDLELAMPSCRAMLRKRIGNRLILAFEGAGYRCRVGEAPALFVHGNNEDAWNTVDHDRLARIAAAVASGARPEAWEANEGTRLVIEVLNLQKQSHPFVEYVKPEKPWLLELIAKLGFRALARSYLELAPRQAAASAKYAARGLTAAAVYLGGPASDDETPATLFDADKLLLHAHRQYCAGKRILESDALTGTLGLRDYVRTSAAPDTEIRDHILASLQGDTTFDPAQGDDIIRSLAPKLGTDLRWIVCGHTHLRRAVKQARRGYFNSGTWMRLLSLYEPTLANQFEKVLEGLNATTPQQLDDIKWTDGSEARSLVVRQPTVVILRDQTGWLADGSPRDGDTTEKRFPAIANTKLELAP